MPVLKVVPATLATLRRLDPNEFCFGHIFNDQLGEFECSLKTQNWASRIQSHRLCKN